MKSVFFPPFRAGKKTLGVGVKKKVIMFVFYSIKTFSIMDKNQNHSDNMWKGASPQIFSNAKKLRENQTEAEEKFWLAVKSNQIE